MKSAVLVFGLSLIAVILILPLISASSWWVRDDSIVQGLNCNVPVKLSYNLKGDGLWRAIHNNGPAYYWNGSYWVQDNSAALGLPWTLDQLIYNQKGLGEWTATSAWQQQLSGYYWNGTFWINDDSRILGLLDPLKRDGVNFWAYGEDVRSGFTDDKLTYWLSTYKNKNYGYYWNGTYWVKDNIRVNGLPLNSFAWNMFYDSSCGQWNAVTFSNPYSEGIVSAYYWNGTYWVEDPEMAPIGLTTGGYTFDVVEGISEERWLIVGDYNQKFYGFRYVGGCTPPDQDNDGVPDSEDKCPDTTGQQIVYGCSCEQILAFKPGNTKGELKNGCSQGTVDVFTKKIGWAKDLF
jgi:hypothetical protein